MEQHRRLNCTCNVLFTLVRLEANMTKYLLLSILVAECNYWAGMQLLKVKIKIIF